MKKWIIIAISTLVAFVLLGVVSIFFIVGVANRAAYKRETQTLVVDTFAALRKTKSGGPAKSLAVFEQLKEDSGNAADQLESQPAPRGAEELKTDAIQVIDLAADIADRGILMFTYVDKVDKIISRWSDEIKSANSQSDPIAKLQKDQTATDKAGTELKGLRPPGSLVSFHLELTELLATMTTKLGDMAAAANAKDAAKLKTLSSEWETLATRIDKLSSTIGSDLADDIMPPGDQRKLERLATKIDSF